MRVRILPLALLFGILPAGCDSAEVPPPALQGRYEGTFRYIAPPGPFSAGGPVDEAWVLTLDAPGRGQVSGAGTLGDGAPITVLGRHDHPEVTLHFSDDQGDDAGRFTGTLSDDGRVLDGAYTFNLFFTNHPVTFTRVARRLP